MNLENIWVSFYISDGTLDLYISCRTSSLLTGAFKNNFGNIIQKYKNLTIAYDGERNKQA